MTRIESLLKESAGSLVQVPVDWWVLNDAAAAPIPDIMAGQAPVRPEKTKVFIDHDTPCGSSEVAMIQKELIVFAQQHGCELFNGTGISYQLMTDHFVGAGDIVATASSHACFFGAVRAIGLSLSPDLLAQSLLSGNVELKVPETVHIELSSAPEYPVSAKDIVLRLIAEAGDRLKDRSVEFIGTGAASLPLADRIVIAHMTGAAGARFSFFDSETKATASIRLDPAAMLPAVSEPDTLLMCQDSAALKGTPINQVFIGGCAGGRIEDLRTAAAILQGKKVPDRLRLFIAPATADVYRQAADEGLLSVFLDAGALVMNQGCSVCWGKSQGILGAGESMLSAGSRNSPGCAGSPDAHIYLSSPATAAASALTGRIETLQGKGGAGR